MGKSTKINIPGQPDCERGSQAAEARAALHKSTSPHTLVQTVMMRKEHMQFSIAACALPTWALVQV